MHKLDLLGGYTKNEYQGEKINIFSFVHLFYARLKRKKCFCKKKIKNTCMAAPFYSNLAPPMWLKYLYIINPRKWLVIYVVKYCKFQLLFYIYILLSMTHLQSHKSKMPFVVIYLIILSGCPRKKFQCVSNMKCIKRSLVCNKKRNCKDGSDEANCE